MRTCMFCRERASTKEDAWPLWLMKRFGVSCAARMYAERGGSNLGNWPTAKPKLQVKWLCARCNSGWMSSLENEAKPIVDSILDNKLKELDMSAQSTLARWATKTAMVLEAIDSSRPWFYSDGERQSMRSKLALPPRTSVWIAKCVNQPDIYSAAKRLWGAPGDEGARALCTTMAFGSLALQVVSIKIPAAVPGNVAVTYESREGPWDQVLVRVWPPGQRSRTWPPRQGLAGDWGLDVLTERLSPTTR